jgi:Cytochrome c554 and c-prime
MVLRLCSFLCFGLFVSACTRGDAPSQAEAQAEAPTEVGSSPVLLQMPGPNRGRMDSAVRDNDACVVCHEEQATEWRGSLHQRSDVDPAYRQALAIEPLAFCRGCHAPEADNRQDAPSAVSALGVGCVTCHVTEQGIVLAAPAEDAPIAPHPVRRSAEFAKTGACVNCHEFTFPNIEPGNHHDDSRLMQTTVREHARSSAANTPCADCHMPVERGHRSHSFAQVRDPQWLRKTIDVRGKRGDFDEVIVTLRQTQSGHAFPTGDLFRRLEISAELRDDRGQVVRRDERRLARHFIVRPGVSGRYLQADDRLFDEPVTVDLDVSPPANGRGPWRVFYWVKLQRVATVGEGSRAKDSVIESEVVLHSGDFSW